VRLAKLIAEHLIPGLALPGLDAIHRLYREQAGFQLEVPGLDLSGIAARFPAAVDGYTSVGQQQEKERRDRKPSDTIEERNAEICRLSAEGKKTGQIRIALRPRWDCKPATIRKVISLSRKRPRRG
jgi:hypothetical protein